MVGNFTSIHSPLQANVQAAELLNYPDKAYAKYILQGISNGFKIHYSYNISKAQTHLARW